MSSTKTNTQQIAKGSGTTGTNVMKFQYEWKILDFSFLGMTKETFVQSPIFCMGRRGEYKWQLKVYPYHGIDTGLRFSYWTYYLSVQVICLDWNNEPNLRARCRLSIFNDKKKPAHVSQDQNIYKLTKSERLVAFPEFIKRNFLLDPVNNLLPDDTLTLVCELTCGVEGTSTFNIDTVCLTEVSESQLPDDLYALFESSRLYDVTLIACGREFRAHKAILAARSSVFLAMFENEMKERRENRVNIIDVDVEVLNEMLRFIYTGKLTKLDQLADGLLAAADKYQLEDLKSLCIKELEPSLSIENAANLLIIADLYRVAHLKSQVLNFIFKHTKEVLETASFNSMQNTHPSLVSDVIANISDQINGLKLVDNSCGS